jgi:hypothetical protein
MCACCGSGDISGGRMFVAGQLSQTSEAVTYTLSHTHRGGVIFHREWQAFMCLLLHWHHYKEKENQVSLRHHRNGDNIVHWVMAPALLSDIPGFKFKLPGLNGSDMGK